MILIDERTLNSTEAVRMNREHFVQWISENSSRFELLVEGLYGEVALCELEFTAVFIHRSLQAFYMSFLKGHQNTLEVEWEYYDLKPLFGPHVERAGYIADIDVLRDEKEMGTVTDLAVRMSRTFEQERVTESTWIREGRRSLEFKLRERIATHKSELLPPVSYPTSRLRGGQLVRCLEEELNDPTSFTVFFSEWPETEEPEADSVLASSELLADYLGAEREEG